MNQAASPDLIAAAREAVPALLSLSGVTCMEGASHDAAGIELGVGYGEIVGVVGERGAGLSTLARVCAGLITPVSGTRLWKGRDWARAVPAERNCACRVQLVAHDARASLDPRWTVEDIVAEGPLALRMISRKQRVEYAALLLNRVALDPMQMRQRPGAFTPGQCVRIALARALAVKPDLVVLDDVLASLDPLERAQVLDLLLDLRRSLGVAFLVLGHDPRPIAHISDRLVVLCAGRVVEAGPADDVARAPLHPYARALLADLGPPIAGKRVFVHLAGDGDTRAPSAGCPFAPRCPHAMAACRELAPPLVSSASDHQWACHLELAPSRDARAQARARPTGRAT